MRPHRRLDFLLVVCIVVIILMFFSFVIIADYSQDKVTGSASSILYNRTGLCGNYEVDMAADEECDNFRDEKCPGRCNNKICMCFPETEKRSGDVTPSRYFFYFDKLTENETGTITFEKLGISFTGAKFIVNGTQKEFRIIVDTNLTFPDKLRKIEGAKIHQLFRIQLYNITAANVTSTSISFRVYKNWLRENNFTAAEVTLRKHSDNYLQYHYDWQQMQTALVNEDDFYYNYKVESSGFSFFAIVAERPAVCGNNVCEKGEDFSNCCTDCGVRQTNEFCQNNTIKEIKCGDNFCDTQNGESQANCCIDCSCPTGQTCEFNVCQTLILCGNNICEESENAINCVQDCGKKVFFNPLFILLITILIVVGFLAAFGFKKEEVGIKRIATTILSRFESEEEQLKEKIKEWVGKYSIKEMKERLISEGWEKNLVEKILHEFRPEFEPVMPKSFDLERHISEELKKKPLHTVRAELLAKGWPAQVIDKILRKGVLLNLAKKYELHLEPKNKDKFRVFAKACKALNCEPTEVRDIFVQLNWNKNLIERALRQMFK